MNRSIKPNHMADLDKAVGASIDRHMPDGRQQRLAQDHIQTLNVKDQSGKAAGLITHEAIRT